MREHSPPGVPRHGHWGDRTHVLSREGPPQGRTEVSNTETTWLKPRPQPPTRHPPRLGQGLEEPPSTPLRTGANRSHELAPAELPRHRRGGQRLLPVGDHNS